MFKDFLGVLLVSFCMSGVAFSSGLSSQVSHSHAALKKISDPLKYAFMQSEKIFSVSDCDEQFDDSGSVSVVCTSEVFETDLPCPDPSSPSGLEMCYGVEVYQSCEFEFRKNGAFFQLESGPLCDTYKVE